MAHHLQTILNCVAEPITLAQDVSESVSVVINQRSLRHDVQISTTFATYFPVRLCPYLLKLGRKNVKPNIDFDLVHLNPIQLFPVSKEESKSNSKHTI